MKRFSMTGDLMEIEDMLFSATISAFPTIPATIARLSNSNNYSSSIPSLSKDNYDKMYMLSEALKFNFSKDSIDILMNIDDLDRRANIFAAIKNRLHDKIPMLLEIEDNEKLDRYVEAFISRITNDEDVELFVSTDREDKRWLFQQLLRVNMPKEFIKPIMNINSEKIVKIWHDFLWYFKPTKEEITILLNIGEEDETKLTDIVKAMKKKIPTEYILNTLINIGDDDERRKTINIFVPRFITEKKHQLIESIKNPENILKVEEILWSNRFEEDDLDMLLQLEDDNKIYNMLIIFSGIYYYTGEDKSILLENSGFENIFSIAEAIKLRLPKEQIDLLISIKNENKCKLIKRAMEHNISKEIINLMMGLDDEEELEFVFNSVYAYYLTVEQTELALSMYRSDKALPN